MFTPGGSVRNGSDRAVPTVPADPERKDDTMKTCGTPSSTPHAIACELDLAETYARHGRHNVASECAWAAYDLALRLGRVDLAVLAGTLLGAIESHRVSYNGGAL
jgi:hypothetical protein